MGFSGPPQTASSIQSNYKVYLANKKESQGEFQNKQNAWMSPQERRGHRMVASTHLPISHFVTFTFTFSEIVIYRKQGY